jgi:hypothetical protein
MHLPDRKESYKLGVYVIAGLAALTTGAWAVCAVRGIDIHDKAKQKQVIAYPSQPRGQGEDANIRDKSEVNDPAIPAPPERTKGLLCGVALDNHTPWKIQVYFDQELQGLIPGYGDLGKVFITPETMVYARAEFKDGSRKNWGPRAFTCTNSEIYEWQLEPKGK